MNNIRATRFPGPAAEEVNVTDALPIGYEDHKAFYQTNAERVFKL